MDQAALRLAHRPCLERQNLDLHLARQRRRLCLDRQNLEHLTAPYLDHQRPCLERGVWTKLHSTLLANVLAAMFAPVLSVHATPGLSWTANLSCPLLPATWPQLR